MGKISHARFDIRPSCWVRLLSTHLDPVRRMRVLVLFLCCILVSACSQENAVGPSVSTLVPVVATANSTFDGSCTRQTAPPDGFFGGTNTGTFVVFNATCSAVNGIRLTNTGSLYDVQTLQPQSWGYFQAPPESEWEVCFSRNTLPESPCWQGPPQPPYGTTVPIPLHIYSGPPSPRRPQFRLKYRCISGQTCSADLGVRG
jgi:hypothetical protein